MVSKTNSSEFGEMIRDQNKADMSGTHPGTSVGRVHRSSGRITPKYRRAPHKPVTTNDQTRNHGLDITGIGSDDDPSVDPKVIPADQVELGLRMVEEIKAGLGAKEVEASAPVERRYMIVGSGHGAISALIRELGDTQASEALMKPVSKD